MSGTIHIQNTSWWNPQRLWSHRPNLSSLSKIPSIVASVSPKAIMTYTARKVLEAPAAVSRAFNRGKEATIHWALKNHPEMFFRLHILLEEFQKSTSGEKTINMAVRHELAERLEDFIQECSPIAEQKTFIEKLCEDLRNSSVSFDQAKRNEMEALNKILTPHAEKHGAYILAKIAERHALEQLPGVASQAPVQAPKEKTIQGIEEQIDVLKSNSIKLVLGSIMLYTTLGISIIKDINPTAKNLDFVALLGINPANAEGDLVKLLIEASNKMKIEGMNSDEIFLMLLDRVIDHSDRNIFSRYHAKFRCRYMSKLISSYMNNLFDKLKDSLVYFANLPPTEQLDHISALFINPLADHLSQTEKGYADIAHDQALLNGHHQKIAGSISNMLTALLNQTKLGQQTPDQLLDNFIEVFLDQFIDPIHQHWTRKARITCLEKASRSTFFVKWTFKALAGLSWTAGKIIAPFQWTLNEAIRLILRKTIVSLFPGLFGATKNALEIGNAYSWHSLKKNLVLLLQQTRLNRLKPRTEDPYQPLPAVPPAASERFNTLIDQLLKVMLHQDETSNPKKAPTSHAIIDLVMKGLNLQEVSAAQNGLTEFLGKDGKGLVHQLQHQLHDILKTNIADLATTMCAQEGFFNDTLLSSLTSTNANSFSPQVVIVSEEDKRTVEAEFQKELSLLGENILQDLKANSSDKNYQKAANVYVNTLKQQVNVFQRDFSQNLKNPDLKSLDNLKALYTKFTQSIEELRKKIHESVDASTEALLNPYIEHCLASAKEGFEIFTQLETAKNKLDELEACLLSPAKTEKEIYAIREQLRALNFRSLNEALTITELTKLVAYKTQILSQGQLPLHLKERILQLMEKYKKAFRRDKAKRIHFCNAQFLSLAEWANNLKYVKVTAKPTAADAGLALAYGTPLAHATTSSLLQSYGKNFFHFIGQECHIDGIVQRMMKAYINKPPMQRKTVIVPRLLQKRASHKLHSNIAKLTATDWTVFMTP